MKGSVVLCLMFVSVMHGLPAAPSKKDEVELVPRKGSPFGDQPIVDTGALFPEDDEGLFGGFQYFQSLMTRIRQQMDDLLKTLPFHGSSNETDFGGLPIGGGLPIVPRFPSVDLGKGNTTSVTKVIDGHKVVINETEYKKEDDFGGAYLKVRIVDLQPDSSEAVSAEEDSSEPSAAAALDKGVTKDREPIETNSFENEIPKGREESTTTLETFDEIDSSTTPQKFPEKLQSHDLRGDTNVNKLVSDKSKYYNPDAEFIDKEPIIIPIDLNRDTYINDLAARFGKPINPDAEVFIPEKNTLEDFDETIQRQPIRYDNIESFDDEDNTVYPTYYKPVDLSRDTLVNELLENKMQSYNKDAEFIPPSLQYQPKKIQKLESLEDEDKNPPNLSGDVYVNQLAAMSGRPTEELAELVDLEGRRIEQPKYEYRRFR